MTNLHYRWVIVAAGGLLGCLAIGAMFSLPVFLLPISRDTGWSVTGVSSAMTIGFLAMAFASIAWGSLSDRWGARPIVFIGSVLLAVSLMAASWATPNAVIQPVLGRPLAGNAANQTLQLLPPKQHFSDRTNQLDIRFAKLVRLSGRRIQVALDLYNALNANTVQNYNNSYSPTGTWRTPTGILPSRVVKVSGQVDF